MFCRCSQLGRNFNMLRFDLQLVCAVVKSYLALYNIPSTHPRDSDIYADVYGAYITYASAI